MTATTFSPLSSRRAERAEQGVAVGRPGLLSVLAEAVAAARAVQTASPRSSVVIAARFAARV